MRADGRDASPARDRARAPRDRADANDVFADYARLVRVDLVTVVVSMRVLVSEPFVNVPMAVVTEWRFRGTPQFAGVVVGSWPR